MGQKSYPPIVPCTLSRPPNSHYNIVMRSKHILAVIGLVVAVSAGSGNIFAGAFQQLAGGPNFDGSALNNAPVLAAASSGPSALTSNAAVEARMAASKSTASTVPALTAPAETATPAVTEPPKPVDPLAPVKKVLGEVKTPLTLGVVGGYLGWVIAGTVAGAMTGGLLLIAFFLLSTL